MALAAAGLIGSTALPGIAVAQDWDGRGGGRQGMHGPGMDDMGPMRGMMRDLDLSEEQRTRIRDIMQNARQQGEADRQAMQELRTRVDEAVAADGFDEARVRAIIESGMPQITENMVRRARTMAEVRTVLTPEQREKFDARRAEMHQRMSKGGRRRGD
jgi:protein CpxP